MSSLTLRICQLLACVLTANTLLAADIDFAHDVVPILKQHCAECHTAEKSEGGFSFSTERLLKESGYAEPGQPDDSRLIELIESQDADDQMPPADKPRLTEDEVATLRAWVQQGLTWEPGFRFGEAAWEPPLQPRTVELPPAEFPGQNPIDRLLARYRKTHELQQPPIIEDEVFLRRASLDLIGLLPTVDEQNEFLDDPRSNRRNELLTRLLHRDHDYAEHWITFWNDLLRNDYAGTGYIDGGRKQITEWLYRSLLENKPYDQFVSELIAPADEASGFINGIKWRGNVNASQVTEIQFSQNVAQVFLGINMKCASCHDSFIDRWTLDEAYSLAAVYSTRPLEIHRCDKPTGRMAQAGWIFPKLGQVDPQAEQPERLKQLAALMTDRNNGRFARTIVNRIWHRLMGRGIVHPVDAMHTKPWDEDLLEYLAAYLVENNHDLRQVMYLIASSQAYQSVCVPAEDSATSAEFTFTGPTPRHLTAEQFIDATWQLTSTSPAAIEAPIAGNLYQEGGVEQIAMSGKWIWSYADTSRAPAGEIALFMKQFELSQRPQKSAIVLTCDNEYTLLVNGHQVAQDNNWTTVETVDLTPHLVAGTNTVQISGRNAGQSPNAAGLYAEIVVVDSAGQRTYVATDETWQASRDQPQGTDWSAVQWSSAASVTPQNFLGPDVQATISSQLSQAAFGRSRNVRASLVKSDMLMRSLGRPNREQVVTTRPASLSTLQAIDLANGEILNDLLAQGATRLHSQAAASPARFAQTLYQQALTREPSGSEMQLAMELLGESPSVESVQDLLWSLIMLPEFQFVD